MIRNKISNVCFYFCSTERSSKLFSLPRNGSKRNFYFCSTVWNSEHISLPRNGKEQNSERLLLFLFHGLEFCAFLSSADWFRTEFRDFSGWPNNRNSLGTNHLFRLFRLPQKYFLSKITNPSHNNGNCHIFVHKFITTVVQ
jgi:hypothetical protein